MTKEKQAERAKKILVSEYFSSSGRVPEIDGVLYMKDGYRKPWKKFYFMLRASGLYQSTKGKSTVRGPTHLMHTYALFTRTYIHTYIHTYMCVPQRIHACSIEYVQTVLEKLNPDS